MKKELNSAVDKYIESKELVLMAYPPEYIEDVKADMGIAFKAGAKWISPSYNTIEKVLAIGFMKVLDEIRPENKMCLSNGECMDIEKAFDERDWEKLKRYLKKYSPATR